MGQKIRTFVAVDIGPGVRAALQRELPRLIDTAPEFNWIAPENFHFTLSFLGEVLDRETPDICQAIARAVERIEEFELEIVGLRAFPSVDRIRYVWAGVGRGKEELCRLQSTVADAVQTLGFPRDRETYTPHLTIARVRRHSPSRATDLSALDSLAEQSFGVCSIDEVIVFASYLDKKGPTYVPMSTISLAY
jgi:2'-5' RNA ligase